MAEVKRLASIAAAALMLGGCVSPATIKALSQDNASICVNSSIEVPAIFTARTVLCRSNDSTTRFTIDQKGDVVAIPAPKP